MFDITTIALLTQISELQDKVETLEEQVKLDVKWLESIQNALERAHDRYSECASRLVTLERTIADHLIQAESEHA